MSTHDTNTPPAPAPVDEPCKRCGQSPYPGVTSECIKRGTGECELASRSNPPAERPTPITDADDRNYPQPEYLQLIQFEGCTMGVIAPEDYAELYEKSRDLERQLAEANEKLQGMQDGIDYATDALMREKALADRLAESLERADALAAAWTAYYQSAPQYGNGAAHPLHLKINEMSEQALTAWKEARKQP